MVMKELNIIRCLFGEVERLILIVVASEFVDFNEMVLTYTSCQVLPVLIYTEAAQVSLERPSGAVHRVETVRHLKLLMRERGNGRTSQLFVDIAG